MDIIENSDIVYSKSRPHLKRNLIVIAFCLALIYLLNNLLYSYVPYIPNDSTAFFWLFLKQIYSPREISCLTMDFTNCMWAINVSLFITMLGYFSFLLYNPARYTKTVNILINLSGILAIFTIYRVFPFKFDSSLLNSLLKTLFIMIMAYMVFNILSLLFKRKLLNSFK
jgi:hypothetical protein